MIVDAIDWPRKGLGAVFTGLADWPEDKDHNARGPRSLRLRLGDAKEHHDGFRRRRCLRAEPRGGRVSAI